VEPTENSHITVFVTFILRRALATRTTFFGQNDVVKTKLFNMTLVKHHGNVTEAKTVLEVKRP